MKISAELATIFAAFITAIAGIGAALIQVRRAKDERKETPKEPKSDFSKDYLENVLSTKILRGGCVKHPPLSNFEYKDNLIVFSGLYVDMFTEVCKANGLQAVLVPVDWSEIPDQVFTTMGLDLVLSVFETSQRAQVVDFTACFHKVSVSGITQAKGSKIKDISDLYREDVRVVVTKGEAGWEYVTRDLEIPKQRLIVMENSNLTEMMEFVRTKRVDVAICDEVSCFQYAADHPEVAHIFRDKELYICKNCIIVPKGQPKLKEWVRKEFSRVRNLSHIQEIEQEILSDPEQLIRRYM